MAPSDIDGKAAAEAAAVALVNRTRNIAKQVAPPGPSPAGRRRCRRRGVPPATRDTAKVRATVGFDRAADRRPLRLLEEPTGRTPVEDSPPPKRFVGAAHNYFLEDPIETEYGPCHLYITRMVHRRLQ